MILQKQCVQICLQTKLLFKANLLSRRCGLNDPRAKVLAKCLDTIVQSQPKAFILENAAVLMTQKKFRSILDDIVDRLQKANYEVQCKLMSTDSHGLPQSRERTYIVGIRHVFRRHKFHFPIALSAPISLSRLIDTNNFKQDDLSWLNQRQHDLVVAALQRAKEKHGTLSGEDILVIDLGCSATHANSNIGLWPTVTATRGRGPDYLLMRGGKFRKASIDDIMAMQGFAPGSIDWEAAGVSRTAAGTMLGNAMSCNILERLLPRVLFAIGISPPWVADPWDKLARL